MYVFSIAYLKLSILVLACSALALRLGGSFKTSQYTLSMHLAIYHDWTVCQHSGHTTRICRKSRPPAESAAGHTITMTMLS